MWLVAGLLSGRGVRWVRGMCRMLWWVVTCCRTELRVTGTTHHRGGRDNSKDTPTWMTSLPVYWEKEFKICQDTMLYHLIVFLLVSQFVSELTGSVSRRHWGFSDRRQRAAVLLNLVHAHGTVPHCIFMMVDSRRAANNNENVQNLPELNWRKLSVQWPLQSSHYERNSRLWLWMQITLWLEKWLGYLASFLS